MGGRIGQGEGKREGSGRVGEERPIKGIMAKSGFSWMVK